MTPSQAQKMVAKKYAQAFMHVFGKKITENDYAAVQLAHQFLKKNPHILLLFRMPHITKIEKMRFAQKFVQSFSLGAYIEKLIPLLVNHNQAILLQAVLEQIQYLYEKMHNIAWFTIATSHKIEEKEKRQIQEFLAHKTGQVILYKYVIDPNLIGGVRAQSPTWLWECSIQQRLRLARQLFTTV